MRRLLLACAASLILYAAVFGWLLDRPLAYGFIARQMDEKLARAASIAGPKLVILAGSNAAYSHRCETIEAMLALPCVNGGVAVGLGLDAQFARWEGVLRPGDTVYLPMEEAQYVMTRAATRLGPDAAIMLHRDWATLSRLGPARWAAALFSTDLRGALMAAIETALVAGGFDPARRDASVGGMNAWGDHVGHTLALAAPSRAVLASAEPVRASAEAIATGYGAALIGGFTARASTRGIRVIGGLPTGFSDIPTESAALAAIRAVYEAHGGTFLMLAGRSRYPRIAFFDTPEHLNEPCQVAHSRALAAALAPLLGRPLLPAPAFAHACPAGVTYPPALAYAEPHLRAERTGIGQEDGP